MGVSSGVVGAVVVAGVGVAGFKVVVTGAVVVVGVGVAVVVAAGVDGVQAISPQRSTATKISDKSLAFI